MVRNVPDEIIHEILCPVLSISDEDFSTPSLHSPFVSQLESSSAILLVSKTWLRVATPLLYNVIIIRSRGQLQALELALHSNPELGKMVKKLRVEGGYTVVMQKILERVKNLTDICMALAITKGENSAGLCRGLSLIDPVRVIILWHMMSGDLRLKSIGNMVQTLVECIPKWKNLTIFEMPFELDLYANRPTLCATLSKPLKEAQSLRTLVISDLDKEPSFIDGTVPTYISTIASNPSLQEIQPKTRAPRPLNAKFIWTVQNDARMTELINLDSLDVPAKNRSIFIYPPQLAANPQLEDRIWDRILFFLYRDYMQGEHYDHTRPLSWYHHDNTTSVHFPVPSTFEFMDLTSGWELTDSGSDFSSTDPFGDDGFNFLSDTIQPLLVCKRFLRLGIRHLYTTPLIDSQFALRSLARRLAEEPSLGHHVRRLYLDTVDCKKASGDMQKLLARAPNLRGLTSSGRIELPWKVFDELSARSGGILDTFQGPSIERFGNNSNSKKKSGGGEGKVDPGVLARFAGMWVFAWDCETVFDTAALDAFAPGGAFDNLEELTVKRADRSFWEVMARMRLPHLRCAILMGTASESADSRVFFEKHGAKLDTLIVSDKAFDLTVFDCCLNLKVLMFYSEKKKVQSHGETMKGSASHPALERIVFRLAWRQEEIDQDGEPHPEGFLSTFVDATVRTRAFPALREIQHPSFAWDLPEAEMAKSRYPPWAEKYQAQGIELVDRPGVRYRPRRMFVPQRASRSRTQNGHARSTRNKKGRE